MGMARADGFGLCPSWCVCLEKRKREREDEASYMPVEEALT
jgi:hypothetical protein